MASAALTALDAKESRTLRDNESIIERGLSTFYEVGAALLTIRDGRLYRATHKRFEDYCQERWKMARDYANKLIRASELAADLDTKVSKPTSETHARPLAKLPREKRAEVWERAVETAPIENGQPKITAKHVEKVVAKELEPEKPKVFRDKLKQEIPEKLHRVFEAEDLFDTAVNESRSLASAIKNVSQSAAGKFLNITAVNRLIREIRTAIDDARPYALCPYCEGRKCSACAQSGIVPKNVLEQAQ